MNPINTQSPFFMFNRENVACSLVMHSKWIPRVKISSECFSFSMCQWVMIQEGRLGKGFVNKYVSRHMTLRPSAGTVMLKCVISSFALLWERLIFLAFHKQTTSVRRIQWTGCYPDQNKSEKTTWTQWPLLLQSCHFQTRSVSISNWKVRTRLN